MHRHTEQRDRCTTGGKPFAATTATPCERWRTAADRVTLVLTRLRHGCPTQASVAAVGVDERTVAAWLTCAGPHGERGPQHVVPQGWVDGRHVQADAWGVTRVGRRVWMALAWRCPRGGGGGASSAHRAPWSGSRG